MSTRRSFLVTTGRIGAGVLFGAHWQSAWAQGQSPRLAKFIQPLRQVGAAGGIPVAASDGTSAWGAAHYSITLQQFTDQLHPQLPNPTRLWGYRPGNVAAADMRHLGGIIVARRDAPVQITATNALPGQHILPVDTSIVGAEKGQGANHATLHLHGGATPWISDGGPHSWFDPAGHYGASVQDEQQGNNVYKALNGALAAGQAEYFYPNRQGARLMWYHDHALGTTRLNAYAGLASVYVMTDDRESELAITSSLPGPLDARTHYLVFQDKTFVGPSTESLDPTWSSVVANSRQGDLWYAHVTENEREKKWTPLPSPDPSNVPEFFGDTILVNGTVSPYLVVEQRQYRFRMLNACNARFLNPRLVVAKGSRPPDSTEALPHQRGPGFVQIGNEGGFLPAPVMVNAARQPMLLLAPAERADVIVDFRDVKEGSILILYNDAPAPFPSGGAENDYYAGNPKTPSSLSGTSPNTRTLLQIRVVARTGAADPSVSLPASGMQNPSDAPFLVTQVAGVPTAVPPGVPVRRLTLNEGFDGYGRLLQTLGTDAPVSEASRAGAFGRSFEDPATEIVNHGSVEVWEIANLTADTHPIHFHLVNVQVLSRQAFNTARYGRGALHYLSAPMAPEANELGWKETVRMNPGEVTRVIMKFVLPATPFAVPASRRTGGNEYVWHCHILEHEEHDMMRPLVVM